MDLLAWEKRFLEKTRQICRDIPQQDPSHDFHHYERVVATAKRLGGLENARMEVVVPAAWFHDFVWVSKNDSRRKQASVLSAHAAVEYLRSIEYPEQYLEEVFHAIEAHSFSAGIKARTLEAQVVQDADRLDGIGAIGIARCFSLGGTLGREFYHSEDPLCEQRDPQDQIWTVDHFYQKLFKIAGTLHTQAARDEGQQRVRVMQNFLSELNREIKS